VVSNLVRENLQNWITSWNKRHSSEISDFKETVYLIRKSPLTMVGLAVILIFIIMAIFAPYIAPYDPVTMHLDNRLAPPSGDHLLGTDELGRDILSRIIYGAGIALKIVLIVLAIDLPLGILLGLAAGYFGGWIDEII